MARIQHPKVARSPGAVAEKFENQLKHLRKSCRDFDAGDVWEAERISAAVQTICHSSGGTTSLLDQMGLAARSFLDSAQTFHPASIMPSCALTSVDLTDEGLQWRAPLDDAMMAFVPFNDWWNRPIMSNGQGLAMSRQRLIQVMRNQDGGGHVDSEIDAVYAAIRDQHGFVDDRGRETGDGHPYSVRQIGHEVLKSLIPAYRRRADKPQNGMIVSSMTVVDVTDGDPPRPPEPVDYTLQGRATPCGCGSEKSYAACHAHGAQPPTPKSSF